MQLVNTANIHSPLWKTFLSGFEIETRGIFQAPYRDKNDTLLGLQRISSSHAEISERQLLAAAAADNS